MHSHTHPVSRRKRAQSGFSLVEVLVAMLVLAIGLLGLAALQTQGVRFNQDAYVRTSATNLAASILDAMRIARSESGAGAENFVTAEFPTRNPQPADGYSVSNPPYTCDPAPDLTVLTGTSSEKVAQTALPCWLNSVELGLPLGRATIAQQAAPNEDLYDITLMWLDREAREFGGTTRLPNEGECTALTNRVWQADVERCFVVQTWTVWP